MHNMICFLLWIYGYRDVNIIGTGACHGIGMLGMQSSLDMAIILTDKNTVSNVPIFEGKLTFSDYLYIAQEFFLNNFFPSRDITEIKAFFDKIDPLSNPYDTIKKQFPNIEELKKQFQRTTLPNLQNFIYTIHKLHDLQHVTIKLPNEHSQVEQLMLHEKASPVSFFSGCYTKSEINALIALLEFHLRTMSTPTGFSLSFMGHVINLVYFPNEGWQIINANELHLFNDKKTSKEIADYLNSDFPGKNGTGEFTSFSAKLYSTSDCHLRELMKSVYTNDEWLALHEVTEVKARQTNWLSHAAYLGERETVLKLCHAGADPNKNNPLYLAAQNGHEEIVNILIGYHAQIDGVIANGRDWPLRAASRNGFLNIAISLLDQGADPNKATTSDGSSSLWMAAEAGHTGVVSTLLQRGAKPNQLAYDDSSALFKAVDEGYPDVVDELLKYGADVNHQCYGSSLLFRAAYKNYYKTLQILLRHPEINAQLNQVMEKGISPLGGALLAGNTEIVKLLLPISEVNLPDAKGFYPIHKIAQWGDIALANILLTDSRVKIDQSMEHGETALWLASYNGHYELVEFILQHNANEHLLVHGISPLLIAAQRGLLAEASKKERYIKTVCIFLDRFSLVRPVETFILKRGLSASLINYILSNVEKLELALKNPQICKLIETDELSIDDIIQTPLEKLVDVEHSTSFSVSFFKAFNPATNASANTLTQNYSV